MILTQSQLALENSLRRIMPAGVVSLWIPDGYNRAKDIIRGNHGQCFGTHPNVPVLPNLINPSVGWVADGLDDKVDFGVRDSFKLSSALTVGGWFNISPSNSNDGGIFQKKPAVNDYDYMLYFGSLGFACIYLKTSLGVAKYASYNVNHRDDKWHFWVGTFDGRYLKLYIDNVLRGTTDCGETTIRTSDSALHLAHGYGIVSNYTECFSALPFIAKSAWSQQQVNNFYLATKGLFTPRG